MLGFFVDSDGHSDSMEGNCLISQIKEGYCVMDPVSPTADLISVLKSLCNQFLPSYP